LDDHRVACSHLHSADLAEMRVSPRDRRRKCHGLDYESVPGGVR
jgi:hypothetical protein